MKQKYMTRLERWARWMLPPQEAEDVIADYRDIAADSEMLRGLDKPRKVIRPLADTKSYRVWLVVFALMAACALLLALSPLPGGNRLWWFLNISVIWNDRALFTLGNVFPPLGMAVALVWFRWKGQKLRKLPRAVPILLAAVAAWIAAVLAVDRFWMNDPLPFAQLWGEAPVRVLGHSLGWTRPLTVLLLGDALMWGGFTAALLAVFALIKARTGDRRWAAVYILALTAVLLSWQTLSFMNDMSLDSAGPGWWLSHWRIWAVCSAVGVIGTGVALC